MARKANISKEEIHQACWELLEKNTFPNIPRLANYFVELDGRKCSNTTFMNAIAEWEEEYKLQQQHELAELEGLLTPSIERFNREVTKLIGTLLEEKERDLEQTQLLKQQATHTGQLSLASALCELQESYEYLQEKHLIAEQQLKQRTLEHQQAEQKANDALNQNRVLSRQLEQADEQIKKLNLSNSQYQFDLAKQDHKIQSQQSELSEKKRLISTLEEKLEQVKKSDNEAFNDKLNDIQNQLLDLKRSNRGSEQ
ncbi:hypothetical protein [Marinomonas epiphytica]